MGPEGAKANPSYREVCSGRTGHVEVFEMEFEETGDAEGGEMYEKLVRHFFSFHDPTTPDCQGNDTGSQYASVIFCYSPQQMTVAERVKAELQALLDAKKITSYRNRAVVTHILPATTFYPAEEEHQQYLEKNPSGYCNHAYRFNAWPKL